jgi:hypothetical protein
MEHVVFFPAHDGTPAFRRVSSLEDAVRLVEHLRNVENVAELSVHSLSEVPLAFKTFYRVEVPVDEAAPAVQAAPVVEAPVMELPAVEVPAVEATVMPALVLEPPSVEAVAVEATPEVAVEAPVVEVPAQAEAEPVPAMANGHKDDAPSSLGFFSA